MSEGDGVTGRGSDRDAAWERRELRNQAVQRMIRDGSAEDIRASSLCGFPERVPDLPAPPGPRAAVVGEAIYRACGPRLGAALVQANVVLTLGGYRGQTEFGLVNPSPGDERLVPVADLVGRRYGVRFRTHPGRDYLDRPLIMVEVESLPGYAYGSAWRAMPGTMGFHERAGWAGLGSWQRKVYRGVQLARARGEIPALVDVGHAFTGVIKGYPGVAILRYLEAVALEVDEETMIDSDLPLARAYECGEPNYDFPPDICDHPDILAHRQLWNDALLEFYTSEWHLAIRHDDAFREARRTAYDL